MVKNRLAIFIASLIFAGEPELIKPAQVIAEPSPVFQSIVEEIINTIPRDLDFRLPSRLPESVLGTISPEFLFDFNGERAYLALEDANCPLPFRRQGRHTRGYKLVCLRFSVTSSYLTSKHYQQTDTYRGHMSTSIELSPNLRGYHFQGADWSKVSWIQNNIYFSIYSGSSSAEELIEMARSMVANSPIN